MSVKQKTGKHAKTESTKIAAERNQWSESSQRSYAYIQFYVDIPWTCRGCGQAFVFTAQEQKQAFEIEKVYIWKRPVLCDACYNKKLRLAEKLSHYEARWKIHKQELSHDLPFLKEWLTLLGEYAQISGRRNHDMIAMLQKLILLERR